MEELLKKLIELFAARRVSFNTDEGGKARALAAQQVGLYEIFQSIFTSIPFNDDGRQGSVDSERFIENILSVTIQFARDHSATINHTGSKLVVESDLPLLDDDAVQSLRNFVHSVGDKRRSSSEAKQFGLMAVAALVAESDAGDISRVIEGEPDHHHRTRIFIAISTYLSAKRASLRTREVNLQIKNEVASAQGLLDNFRADFDSAKETVRSELDGLIAATSQIKSSQHAFEDDIQVGYQNSKAAIEENASGFTEAIKQARERLQNFETTAREEMKLEGVRLNWEKRFTEARLSFKISCGLLFAYLCLTIGAAYCFGLPVVKALTYVEQTSVGVTPAPVRPSAIPDAGETPPVAQTAEAPKTDSVAVAIIHQFGRLIVFSVPVFVWLWAGRALMRYFMRSMLLMDDARQRQTMLDTYFLLSDKGRADERDRPLVLWALFRQTPGHGSDGIEPPDFTEVINAGLKRVNSAG